MLWLTPYGKNSFAARAIYAEDSEEELAKIFWEYIGFLRDLPDKVGNLLSWRSR